MSSALSVFVQDMKQDKENVPNVMQHLELMTFTKYIYHKTLQNVYRMLRHSASLCKLGRLNKRIHWTRSTMRAIASCLVVLLVLYCRVNIEVTGEVRVSAVQTLISST